MPKYILLLLTLLPALESMANNDKVIHIGNVVTEEKIMEIFSQFSLPPSENDRPDSEENKPSHFSCHQLPALAITINFSINSSHLSKSELRKIQAFSNVLQLTNLKQCTITVEGHTDSRGTKKYNQSLSEKRAKIVFDRLNQYGISKNRLRALGYGEDRLYDEENPKGKINRRVEFHLNE